MLRLNLAPRICRQKRVPIIEYAELKSHSIVQSFPLIRVAILLPSLFRVGVSLHTNSSLELLLSEELLMDDEDGLLSMVVVI